MWALLRLYILHGHTGRRILSLHRITDLIFFYNNLPPLFGYFMSLPGRSLGFPVLLSPPPVPCRPMYPFIYELFHDTSHL